MPEPINPSNTVDALAQDLDDLLSRVRHDPATQAVAGVAALTVLAVGFGVVRAVFRRRGLIGKLVLVGTAVAALSRLTDRPGATAVPADGSPPPPDA